MKIPKIKHFLVGFVLIGLLAGIFFGSSISKAAFGISPPWVRNDHMLRNTSYEQIINLSRSEGGKAMQVEVRFDGDYDLIKWIEIEDIDSLIMKAGQETLPVKVTVTVPKRATLKDYRASIYVTLKPLQEEQLGGGTVAITLGANISVEISVIGEEIRDFKVISTTAETLQEGQPLAVKAEIQNLGNTEVEKLDGEVEVHDLKETRQFHTLELPAFKFPIAPDEIRSKTFIFEDIRLDPGEYRLIVRIFKEGQKIHEEKLYQKVEERATPVITAEDVIEGGPALPGEGEAETEPEPEEEKIPNVIEVPVTELRPAASDTTNVFLIFGLAGLGFGLLAMIGVIVVLIFVLKSQQKGAQQTAGGPSQPMPVQPQSPAANAPLNETKADNSDENANMNTDANG